MIFLLSPSLRVASTYTVCKLKYMPSDSALYGDYSTLNQPRGNSLSHFTTTYNTRQIDTDIPAYHKELLTAWASLQPVCVRGNTPLTLSSILEQPLFLNPQIKHMDSVLYYPNWITADIQTIKDLCYLAVPGFLPPLAIHETLTTFFPDRSPLASSHELSNIMQAIPPEWLNLISTSTTRDPPAPLSFDIFSAKPPASRTPFNAHRTKTYYLTLLHLANTTVPALQQWPNDLPTLPNFNYIFWKNLYPPMTPNRYGDITWQIIHRILPTALSLHC